MDELEIIFNYDVIDSEKEEIKNECKEVFNKLKQKDKELFENLKKCNLIIKIHNSSTLKKEKIKIIKNLKLNKEEEKLLKNKWIREINDKTFGAYFWGTSFVAINYEAIKQTERTNIKKTIIHEIAHFLDYCGKEEKYLNVSIVSKYKKHKEEYSIVSKDKEFKIGIINKILLTFRTCNFHYCSKNEFFAENFARYILGLKVPNKISKYIKNFLDKKIYTTK